MNWFLGLPTTGAVLLAMSASAAVSVLGLAVVHPIVPHRLRSLHNDVSGFVLAIVGTVYAVLLAFIAVAVWQSFDQADRLVQTEANLVADLYRNTATLPEPEAEKLRHFLFVYAETVVQDEWPALSAGREDEAAGWQLLNLFHIELAQLRAEDLRTTSLMSGMMRTLDELYDARRGRLHAATSELPAILWWNLLAGAAILMFFTYLFGVPNLVMHATMVALLGALVGLVLTLIVLLNNPFRGENHVSVEPFDRLIRLVENMSYPHK
jgi:hypothetical protein